jgi:uncharacterized membrane protein
VPDIGVLHPQIVHFVVAFLFTGVLLRVVSLFGRPAFAGPAATLLIVLGALASAAAVKSGDDAHGPAERVPGARDAVVEHEEWGERTRNLFLAIAALELVALAVGRNPKRKNLARRFRMASATIGLVGLFVVYETAEHGGDLVYGWAGGVGIRSGEPEDVTHLLIAGLYHQAMLDRQEGRPDAAARLIEEMEQRAGGDLGVQATAAESLLLDRRDPRAALDFLTRVSVPPDDDRFAPRFGLLRADAYLALGMADSARVVVLDLATRFPQDRTVQQRLETMK